VFKFITTRPLWVNVALGILLATGLFLFFVLSLNWCTHHGKSITVPQVTGKDYEAAYDQLKKMGFDVEITDSIYVDSLPPGRVIKQVPDADEVVKENRTVYLLVNRAVPPLVEMPNLIGYSYRSAEMLLNNLGIRIGDTSFKPDFAKNSILEQWHNGAMISPGAKLRKGSVISLVLGDGVGKREFAVPSLIGMRFGDARALLYEYGINFAVILPDPDVSDTLNSYIYWQNPQRYGEDKRLQHIRSGQTMDVRLQLDKPSRDSVDAPDQLLPI
jgi:eukaryotic-like serine/threonine-protein kinase